jgi:ADP-ribose pyrophosphatase YjhB (NUDIX family)
MNFEMNFCRRCGAKLTLVEGNAYKCAKGHTIFWNSSAAVALVLTNDKNEVLSLIRARDPGKGMVDLPGGFVDLRETLEDAVVREMREETGLNPVDYTTPKYVFSGIDLYNYGGEEHVVVVMVFHATMVSEALPTAGDDAAAARFLPLKDIELEKVFFPAIRAAYAWAKDNL